MIHNFSLPVCVSVFLVVCGAPNLPAGTFINLVWKPGGLERQQDGLEAVRLCGDLSHHAPPLPHLLDCTKVKGHFVKEISKCRGFLYFMMTSHNWVVFQKQI